MNYGRWSERCISHYSDDAVNFIDDYFSKADRRVLLIGGAGFDPRSSESVELLSRILKHRLSAKFIKEERPYPSSDLVQRANANLVLNQGYCNDNEVLDIDIFAPDGAIVGGRRIITQLSKMDFSKYTDIIIDFSALSLGIFFTIVLFFYHQIESASLKLNLHLLVFLNPNLDGAIKSQPDDKVSEVRGFELQKLAGDQESAKLWMPVLSEKKQRYLDKIYLKIKPHDTIPVLPFPSNDPKRADRIASSVFSAIHSPWEGGGGFLQNEWRLDPKNFVFADERIPLDIYRTILRLAEERKPVFETFGGSTIVLSPLGSKIPSLGTLMAAIELKLPVVYIESLSYDINWDQIEQIHTSPSEVAHIWLCGDAYAYPS